MGRSSRCSMLSVSLLLLFLLSPAAATSLHSDVIEEQVVYSVGGRRGLLQAATPPTPAATPPTPAATPPTPAATPPTPAATPPTAAATPPTSAATPPTPAATPPAATPPTPIAPAPAPIGVTNGQKLNAIIAVSVVAGVIIIGAILIFCRCQCLRRSKKMPFQRLQMT